MTRVKFEKLSSIDQARTVAKYGTFLAQRILAGNRIYFCALSSFYIELFHDLTNANQSGIKILNVFDDPKFLQSYLKDINISFLDV